ncbi:MAG: DUF3592 domain-containing protein [Planctomycetota bacterium]
MHAIKIIGYLFFFTGLWVFIRQCLEIRGKEVAFGTAHIETVSDSEGSATYKLWVYWKDNEGKDRVYKSSFSSSSTGYKRGDKVRIYYDRDNPDHCGVLSFGYRFGIAWAFILVGISMILFAVGHAVGNQWIAERFPAM